MNALQKGGRAEEQFRYRELVGSTAAVDQQFFAEATETLARKLLGCVLMHHRTAGTIVETEAYLGENDLAAHSSRGITPRTQVIFGPPGHAYVYFIYGMHECLNVVAEPEGKAGCVLIRALQPLIGIPEMRERRRYTGPLAGLANGPAKLTRALEITRKQNGVRLDQGDLVIRTWEIAPQFDIGVGPRIGIRECADWPLRFMWRGHPCLSRPNPPLSASANSPNR